MADVPLEEAEQLSSKGSLSARARALLSIDLRSLAAFRVMLAVTMIHSLVLILPDVDAFLTDQGVLPRKDLLARMSPARISLFLANGSYTFALTLVLINLVAALALLVGYRTRLALVISWVLYSSLTNRALLIEQGGDELLPLLLFWAMFLPLGAVFSVDAALDPDNRRGDSRYLSVATVGLLLQTLYVYFFGALLKTSPEWLPQGLAVHKAISLDTFATPLAHWVRQFPGVTFPLTYFVYFLELLTPILLFFPDHRQRVRSITLALLASMHVGFRLFLDIGHFWLASLSSLSAYIPGQAWDWLSERYWRPEQQQIMIYYDRDCGFCRKTSLLLREFFLPRQVAVEPAQSVPEIGEILEREVSWVVVDWAGNRHLRWDALVFVVRQSALALPLAWLLALWGKLHLGRPTYTLIGRSRRELGRLTNWLLRERPNSFHIPNFVHVMLVGVIFVCFVWNLREHFGATKFPAFPKGLVQATQALGLNQRWTMFAPRPLSTDYWPIIEGRTRDGRVVDVFLERFAPPAMEATGNVMHMFPSFRWRKYINRIAAYSTKRRQHYFSLYAAYLCRDWNNRWQGNSALDSVNITLMRNRFVSIRQSVRTPVKIGSWSCKVP